MNSVTSLSLCFFFFNDTATTEIYTLSLHDALPIYDKIPSVSAAVRLIRHDIRMSISPARRRHIGEMLIRISCRMRRSEEHTSELQSHLNLVCRLLLEKKKK